MSILLIIRLCILILVIVLIDYLYRFSKAIRIERRLARYSVGAIDDDNSLGDIIKSRYNRFIKKSRKKFKGNNVLSNKAEKYNKYIMTGDKAEVIDFIITKLIIGICFVVLVALSGVIKGRIISFISLVISFVIGYYFYDIYLILYNRRRKKKIKNDMLRAVIIMGNAFKAGKSTLQAVEIASLELPNPISIEFKKIYQDLSFGISSDVAFSRFARRVNLEEARYISSSLTILNKTGGNIIAVFASIEKTLFEKKKLEEDLKNSTSASNLVVKVLTVIPIFFVMIVYLLSPTYFNPLFETTLGLMLLALILVMFIVYTYLLNRIMKVKV